MSVRPAASPQLACLLSVLRQARGPLSTGEIVRRMLGRGEPTACLSTLASHLRRSPDLAALGYELPPATRATRDGRPVYLYQLRRLPAEPNQEHAA